MAFKFKEECDLPVIFGLDHNLILLQYSAIRPQQLRYLLPAILRVVLAPRQLTNCELCEL